MAGTLGDMKARIALELARSDLTAQIASAINDAIAICQKYRFRFSEAVPGGYSPTFPTVVGVFNYDAPAPGIFQVDYLECYGPGNTITQVFRKHPELVRLKAIVAPNGRPDIFALEGEKFILAPVPDAIYTMIVHSHILISAPANDAEANNRWMTDGERLIRLLAKREIARDVTRNPTMFAAMNKAFVAEGMQMISEQDRLNFYEAMHFKTEAIPGQQQIIAPS